MARTGDRKIRSVTGTLPDNAGEFSDIYTFILLSIRCPVKQQLGLQGMIELERLKTQDKGSTPFLEHLTSRDSFSLEQADKLQTSHNEKK